MGMCTYDEQEARMNYVSGLVTMKTDDNLVDMMIRCAEGEFRSHPFILAAHSNFDKTMFAQTGFKEGASRKVMMKDILVITQKEVIY